MEGGYKQDTNSYSPFPFQKNKYQQPQEYCHTYRSLHLLQADIFNYFSHHLITIPPLHWRRLCQKNNSKCLGTYIIEKNQPTEEEYLSEYTVALLVYLCRKYRFDGYLINF
jgi:mannosyl-glycoprotein endo-beta-N-acetylglucosaminidase